MEKSIWIYFLVVACVTDLTEATYAKCDRNYKKIGCFKENREELELILTDRDSSSDKSDGNTLNWNRFEESVHSLACRCSEKAKNQSYVIFTLRYWAECWAGKDPTYVDKVAKNSDKRSNECANHQFKTCDVNGEKECVGKEGAEYIYSLEESSKYADGGYTEWGEWSPCTETCGVGITARERTCTSPEPKGKGQGCSHLGKTTETKDCKLTDCPVPPKRWPKGSYGIISHSKCPPNWHEFTHCMDTEDSSNADSYNDFHLGLGNLCGSSSITFRYCFKGAAVPSRDGGFQTKTGKYGEAYVVKNTESNTESSCSLFGTDGGNVKMDTEDNNNLDTYGNDGLNRQKTPLYYPNNFNFLPNTKGYVILEFCKIGEVNKTATEDMIEVGEFNQKFGLFIRDGHRCPMLHSPKGFLYGTQERIIIDLEDYANRNWISKKAPYQVSGSNNVAVTACQYDTSKAKDRIFEWPEGGYGILSKLPCPTDWYEFTHCIDTDDSWNVDNINGFHLGLGKHCGRTSFAIRYCFKGENVPSRNAIFSNSGSAYVINNVENGCGNNGGVVRMYAEPSRNLNIFGDDFLNRKYYTRYHPFKFLFHQKPRVDLSFCKIDSVATNMEVGEFGQRFGLFVKADDACPVLSSPYGMLRGSKQYLQLDLYQGTSTSGDTPVRVRGKGNLEAFACQYDPQS